jgi:cell division septal protein FtsQ
MSAPILDQAPAHQPMPTPPRRRRLALTLLIAGTLVLLATGIGVSLAIASRPAPTAPVSPVVSDEPGPVTPGTQPGPVQQQQPTGDKQTPAPGGGDTTADKAPVLADGEHPAFIRKLDTRGGTVVVDVVQVFKDKAAVDAAVQDGRPRDSAQYLSVYVRNENPRLRTLPLASGFQVNLHGSCEDSTLSRQQLLNKLASNAKIAGTYYYTLTVRDGAVQRIDERLAINAC